MDFLIEPVKSSFETIILSIAANELTSLMGYIYQKGVKPTLGKKKEVSNVNLDSIFAESIVSLISDQNISLPTTPENIHNFLNSKEVRTILRQIYSIKILNDKSSLESVQKEFLTVFSNYTNISEEELHDCGKLILEQLIIACDRALSSRINEGLLSAHDAKSEFRSRILIDELAAIRKNLDLLAEEKPNIHDIDKFEKDYRLQVADRHGYITPPHFDKTIKLPIDSLYVNPILIKRPKNRNEASQLVDIDEFLSRTYRTVILGVPGGGKSTLASKLCKDLATDDPKRLFAGRQVTPILVVLRDFGVEKKKNNCSIIQFIESKANSNYMIPPPNGAFEYMILNGRAIVIFDGLDELLDTSYRQEISADIESFCSYYPSVPIIVTSREVGYDQAPLNEKRFEVFGLAPFNEDQIADYARKWFSADSELTPDQQKEKAASFLKESSIVPDLRSNPLTLSLMCNIYRGENYIPRNRPDVYEKCANMLFERWDKCRGIEYSADIKEIEAHIRPIMAYLAHEIYSNQRLQGGATETVLIKDAADYLSIRQFEDRDEAVHAARNFIEFCRGRAWVFTDIGTTSDGERLYQFTHRTFLEYFTALYLTRIHTTPKKLKNILLPRIEKKEWDVVTQLAFQIQSKNAEDAADSLLTALIKRITCEEDETAFNVLSFAVRSLQFLTPSPKISRKITELYLDKWLSWGLMSKGRKDQIKVEPNEYFADLLDAASENRKTILASIGSRLVIEINKKSESRANMALQIALNISFAISLSRLTTNTDFLDSCYAIIRHIHEMHSMRIRELCKKSPCNCIRATWMDLLSNEDLIKWHSSSILFETCDLCMYANSHLIATADTLMEHLITNKYISKWDTGSSNKKIKKFSHHFEEIGSCLLQVSTPWFSFDGRSDDSMLLSSKIVYLNHEKKEKKRALSEDLLNSPDALFGIFCIFATYLEANQANLVLVESDRSNSSIFDLLRWSFIARFRDTPIEKIQDELKKCNFTVEQCNLILGWIDKKINLCTPIPKEKPHIQEI